MVQGQSIWRARSGLSENCQYKRLEVEEGRGHGSFMRLFSDLDRGKKGRMKKQARKQTSHWQKELIGFLKQPLSKQPSIRRGVSWCRGFLLYKESM